MKQQSIILFFISMLTLFSGFAQTISSQKGLTTAVFTTTAGSIKVYLPDDIRPGEMISGSISASAIGKTARQLEKNLLTLQQYVIELNGQKFPVSNAVQHFQCNISNNIHSQEPLNLFDEKGSVTGKVNIQTQQGTARSAECNIPAHALTAAPFRITGPFDGNSSNTSCKIGTNTSEVLAESKRQCLVNYPENATGMQTLVVQENNQPACSKQVSGVGLQVSAGKLNLLKGERTYLDVTVTGLQHLPDTAKLTVDNITAAVVKMEPADNFMILLLPDSITGGLYKRRFYLQSLQTGTFTVNVNLELPDNSKVVYITDMSDLKNESGYPGSYGYIGDQPCDPEGKTITWRWHKTFKCEIDDRKVLMCGHTKEGDDVIEKLKDLLKELELDKATDISEKMAKAFSTAKTFSYSIHVIRKWVDYDVYYKCINGKWQSFGGVYVRHGTDDMGWHNVKHPSTDCWLTFDSPAAEKEFETALENTLRAACK